MSSLGSARHLPCCALGALALVACHGGGSAPATWVERAGPAVLAEDVGAPEPAGSVPTDDRLGCGRSVLRPRVPDAWDPIVGRDELGVTPARRWNRDPIFLDLAWSERDPHPSLHQRRGPPLVAFEGLVPREQPGPDLEARGCDDTGELPGAGEQI
jgi:hypothetical protein